MSLTLKIKKNKISDDLMVKNKISSILIAVFYSMELLRIFFIKEETTVIFTAVGALLLLLAFIITFNRNKVGFGSREILLFVLILVSIAICSFANKNLELNEVIWYFKYIFMLYVLLDGHIWDKPFTISFYGFSIYIIFKMLTGTSATEIVTGGVSQNGIGLYLLPLIVIYYISSHKNPNMKQNVVVAAVYSLISVWTGSRSAIIVGFLLLIGAIFIEKNHLNKKIFKSLLVVILLAVVACIYLKYSGNYNEYFELISGRKLRSIFEEPRFFIITEYVGACLSDITSMLFGVKLGTTPLLAFYSGNPHNMLIRLHANMGLICFLIVVTKMIRTTFILLKWDKTYLFVFLALVFRGLNDSAGFTGCYDPLVLYFIFYAYRMQKEYRNFGDNFKKN